MIDETKSVIVKCPATIANLGSGFDVMGLCLSYPFDTIALRKTAEKSIIIKHTDEFQLSTDPQKNIVGVTLQSIIQDRNLNHGFEAIIHKNIKPGSGIGSSAASAAGASVAANLLLEESFTSDELIEYALNGESMASGSRHADNIAPCILGGVTLTRCLDPIDILKLPYPELYITLLHPQIEIKTSDARNILKKEVALNLASKQWAQVGSMVAGFYEKDIQLIARSMEDFIVEPQRKVLIPHFDEVKKLALQNGALAGSISGAGPSMFFISENKEIAEHVSSILNTFYASTNIPFHIHNTSISYKGVEIYNR